MSKVTAPMGVPVPYDWLSAPPRTLVIGDGYYEAALAIVTDAEQIGMELLEKEPAPNEHGGYPRVLGDLQRAFIVAGTNQNASEILRIHDALWNWVEKLSPDGDQHELAIIFMVPPNTAENFGHPLAVGLGLSQIEAETSGHAVIEISTPLEQMCREVARVKPMDLPPIRARQAADVRHSAMHELKTADTGEELIDAAKRVSEVFGGQEYHLDLFCRPPSHRNGNQLRVWLNGIVTGAVTPYDTGASSQDILGWLADTKNTQSK